MTLAESSYELGGFSPNMNSASDYNEKDFQFERNSVV